MDRSPSASSSSSTALHGAVDNEELCKTKEIMQKIVASFCQIDDKAVRLIEKCVKEFASSVTCIAAGYKSLDVDASHNVGMRLSSGPLETSTSNTELKSEHIIRSLDNMGYSDFVKPLTAYKTILKAKPVPVPTTTGQTMLGKTKGTDGTADTEANKKAKLAGKGSSFTAARPTVGMSNQPSSSGIKSYVPLTGTAVVQQSAAGPPMPSLSGAKPGYLLHPANAAQLKGKAAKDFKEKLNVAIDRDLIHCNPPITEQDFAVKYGVHYSVVRKRIQFLRQSNVMLNGLRFGVIPKPQGGVAAAPVVSRPGVASASGAPITAATPAPGAPRLAGLPAAPITSMTHAVPRPTVAPVLAPPVPAAAVMPPVPSAGGSGAPLIHQPQQNEAPAAVSGGYSHSLPPDMVASASLVLPMAPVPVAPVAVPIVEPAGPAPTGSGVQIPGGNSSATGAGDNTDINGAGQA